MRVLWLTCTAAGASKFVNQSTHTRGWIASLSDLVKKESSIELAVAFFNNYKNDFKFENDKITYYPIKDKLSTRLKQLKSRWLGKLWDTNLPGILKVIEDFKPDIIQLFGSESGMGDIVGCTKIPIILHLQGLINPIQLHWHPREISLSSIFLKSSIKDIILRRDLISERNIFKKIAKREERVIKNNRYFFGRTEWDKRVVGLYNSKMKYFHCDEILRPIFYEKKGAWVSNFNGVIKLVSIINPEMYKGLDTILKSAQILRDNTNLKFEWKVIGIGGSNRIVRIMEKNKKSGFKKTSIIFKGIMQGEELISELLFSDIFIHPSHIDNSPNSVCEAMLLGMPVIAAYVGGIPSLIDHQYNGLLYNSYDPFDLAGLITESAANHSGLAQLGKNAANTATKRHDPTTIIEIIMNTYQQILTPNN